MICPHCKNELRIVFSKTRVEGDNTPDTPTRVYTVQRLECTNPRCAGYGIVVEHLLYNQEEEQL